jgi:hypothetical protein
LSVNVSPCKVRLPSTFGPEILGSVRGGVVLADFSAPLLGVGAHDEVVRADPEAVHVLLAERARGRGAERRVAEALIASQAGALRVRSGAFCVAGS